MTSPEQTPKPLGEQLIEKVQEVAIIKRNLNQIKQAVAAGHEQFLNALSLLGYNPLDNDDQAIDNLLRTGGVAEIALETELNRTKAELIGRELLTRQLAVRAFTAENLFYRTITVSAIGQRALIDLGVFRKPQYGGSMDYYHEAKVSEASGELKGGFEIEEGSLTLYSTGPRGQRQRYTVSVLDGDATPQVTIDVA